MNLHRRSILGAAAAAGLASTARAQDTGKPANPPEKPKPSLDERYAEAARAHRMRLDWDGARYSGPGWDFLVREAAAAQFLMLGEDHFMAEIPVLAGQLYQALRPAGYERVSVEISPPAATMLDAVLRDGGLEGLKRWLREHPSGVAFYNLAPEARFLAEARALTPGRTPVIWGTDYEVGADRALIARLKAIAPPRAQPAVQALQATSRQGWAEFARTKNPMAMFSFGGDPERVRAVRAAWPQPDPEAALILDTLEATLVVNEHYRAERYYLSNQTRAEFQRASFLRHWQEERAAGRKPKVLMKYGWNHMVRGLGYTPNFDMGTMVPEIARMEGGHAFQLLVIGGPGAKQGVFNPMEWTTVPSPVDSFEEVGIAPVAGQHFETGFTVFDLRPLRALPAAKADPKLVRIVHGFDAMAVLPGATPSGFLLPSPGLDAIGMSAG